MKNLSLLAYILPLVQALPAQPIASLSKRNDNGSDARLVAYVQTFHVQNNPNQNLSLIPLLKEKTGITNIILAALHIDGPNGDITLNDDSPNSTYYDQMWSDVSTLQQNGVNVSVMMGGAAQGSYNGRICNSTDGSIQDDYYLGLLSMLRYHKLDGIDLDIEEDVATGCPNNLVHRLNADLGDDFIITMAPVASDLTPAQSGLSSFKYKKFDESSAGALVNWYNTQYYSGFVEGTIEESYEAAVKNGFSPNRIVMGVLDASSDGDGWVSLQDVQETVTNLESKYSDFGGVDGWEYFNAGSSDNLAHPWQWVKQVGESLYGTDEDSVSRRAVEYHQASMPPAVQDLMAEGYGQLEAARAWRLSGGDVEQAVNMLENM